MHKTFFAYYIYVLKEGLHYDSISRQKKYIYIFFFVLNNTNIIFSYYSNYNLNLRFNGAKAILSGPAGGVIGYASTYEKMAVIGFDMGGTSTDVSRYSGRYEHIFESTIAGITLQLPQVNILSLIIIY